MLNRQKICHFIKGKPFSRALKCLIGLIIVIFLTHPGRFNSRYAHVPDYEIENYLVPSKESVLGACPIFPNASLEVREVVLVKNYDERKFAEKWHIKPGGWWSPNGCEPVHSVAIVIPYRDREDQLNIFLHYMHEFLQSQLISYRIIIVEQDINKAFNRGKLMNVGYNEAMKIQQFPCFIFQDIDLLPEVLKNIYACTKLPRHMSSAINIWRYNLLYHGAFGGAIAMLSEQFQHANGFSNVYFGWGAEDDDLLLRIRRTGLDIIRFSPEISRYFMLPHKSQVKNPQRFAILNDAVGRIHEDGLNSLTYDVLSYRLRPLYTHVVVRL